MKNLLAALAAVVVLAGVASVEEAEAARLGGGKSVGMQRGSTVVRKDAAPAAPAPSTAPAAAPAPQVPPPAAPQPARSGLWGMLGGLALGAGLGALMAHFGVGAEFGGLLMVLAVVFAVVMLFRVLSRRSQPQPQYAGAGAPVPPPLEPAAVPAASAPAAVRLPSGFDLEAFLRHAKLNFVRLQAANDAGNLDDIRQFTTPEMYAEIQLQFNERGRGGQQTDVVQLDAELLDLATEGKHHLGSVRFHGLMRESAGSPPAPFEEVWHLLKPTDGSSGWVLAGIEQFA